MATDAEETQGTTDQSTEQSDKTLADDDTRGVEELDDETKASLSQEELAEQDRKAHQAQLKESKRKVGPLATAAMGTLVAIGLITMYLATTVIGLHPLVEQSLYVVGAVNLGLAVALLFRRNWARTLVLVWMAITIFIMFLNLTLISSAKYVVLVLCVVQLFLQFRQPILDEYDAPKE
jgi:uncharacterized membrane protein YgcG